HLQQLGWHLRTEFLLPLTGLAPEARPQLVVVPAEGGDRCVQSQWVYGAAALEQHRLVVVMRMLARLLEEAGLDGSQRDRAADQSLGSGQAFSGADDLGQLGDCLVQEDLPWPDRYSRTLGSGSYVNSQNRVATEFKEVTVNADL